MDRVKGKVAIVTGAGSRADGIGNGRAAAILLAREGYPTTEFNVEETNTTAPELEKYPKLYAPWAKNYTDGSGAINLGWILKQPDLAKTFEAIASDGPQHLYGGALGKAVVEHLKSQGGCLTLGDLEAMLSTTAPVWVDPTPPLPLPPMMYSTAELSTSSGPSRT